jgi:hypothetical protein
MLETGDGSGAGTLTLNQLTLGSTGTDVSTINLTTNAVLSVTNSNGLVINSGPGSVCINLGGPAPASGRYKLISYQGALGGTGFAAFRLGTTPVHMAASLVNNTTNSSIDLVISALPPVTANPTLLASGNIQLGGSGVPGQTYTLQAATNLFAPVFWATITNATADVNGNFLLTDPDSTTNWGHRFYRVMGQ